MCMVVEVIPYKTFKERLRLQKINNKNNKNKCKIYDKYITIEKQVKWLYDDRI